MTEAGGGIAARYTRASDGPRIVVAFVLVEAVCAIAGGIASPLLLVDVLVVPAGLAVGVVAFIVRARRRRRSTAESVRNAAPTFGRRLDLGVHAVLLGNLTIAAVDLLGGALSDWTGAWGWVAAGTVIAASLAIPFSVAATWSTAFHDVVDQEAAALRAGGDAARRVRATRIVARISAGVHVPLAIGFIVASLHLWVA